VVQELQIGGTSVALDLTFLRRTRRDTGRNVKSATLVVTRLTSIQLRAAYACAQVTFQHRAFWTIVFQLMSGGSPMASRLPIFARVAVFVLGACAVLTMGSARAQDAAASNLSDSAFQAIVSCLSRGQEIVMAPKPECKSYGEGAAIAEASRTPYGAHDGDWDRICQAKDDPRRLAPDAIKRIAAQRDAAIAPTGIRIIGAVFCRGVDLVGLDLPYSIVIDHSVVVGNVDARNLRVKGDLSLEYALVLGKVLLNRAHIEGSAHIRRTIVTLPISPAPRMQEMRERRDKCAVLRGDLPARRQRRTVRRRSATHTMIARCSNSPTRVTWPSCGWRMARPTS
jgi:hypothetical protein